MTIDPDTCTLQEAAAMAGYEDYRLEPGGGIRSWDSAAYVGVVLSEAVVRSMARAQDQLMNAIQRRKAR